jgi:predicted enzyme related to lactoylglutathione lyase
MARAVGVGGIFLKAQDPKALSAWYAKHFGIAPAEETSLFFDGPSAVGMTVFAHFPRDTEYFGLDEMLAQLAAAGVTIDPKRDDHAFGRFAWIVDPEGNRVELWEPPASESA